MSVGFFLLCLLFWAKNLFEEAEMHEKFETSHLRAKDRLSYWRDAVCRNLNGITCRCPDETPFNARLVANRTEDHIIARLSGSRHRAIRTEKARREHGDDFFVLFYQLEGPMGVSFNDTEFELQPNDLYIYDGRQNHQLIFESHFNHIAIRVPRYKLRDRWQSLEQRGSFHLKAGTDPMTRLLGANIRAMAGLANEMPPAQLERAIDNAFDLFNGHVSDMAENRSGTAAGHIGGIYARALTFIDRHVADLDLSSELVADHLGISRRYLDRIFQQNGESVHETIQSLRLQNCASELASQEGRFQGIADIAYGWGFQNAAHFSKAFRKKYNQSPSDYRNSLLRPGAIADRAK